MFHISLLGQFAIFAAILELTEPVSLRHMEGEAL